MSDKHPTCPKCKGLLKYELADIVGPERVTCILCGWWKTRSSEHNAHIKKPSDPSNDRVNPSENRVKETNMATKITHGTCNHCNRENVNMPSPGKCSRCYDRMKRGVDIFTGKPIGTKVPTVGASSKSTRTEPAPAILADDEPDTCLSIEKEANSTQIHVPENAVQIKPEPSAAKPARLLRAHDFTVKRMAKRQLSESIPAEIGYITSPGVSIELLSRELFSDDGDLNLLTQLMNIARSNRRTLHGEILYRLDKSLEAA
jgi:hypothetical protein